MNDTINLRMTWVGMLPSLIALMQDGSAKGRKVAMLELTRMARLADDAFKPLEITIYPNYSVDIRPEGSDPLCEYECLTEEQAEAHFAALCDEYPQAFTNDLRSP